MVNRQAIEERKAVFILSWGDAKAERFCFMLKPEYFADKLRRRTYEACVYLFENKKAVSTTTIVEYLKTTDGLSQFEASQVFENEIGIVEIHKYAEDYQHIAESLKRAWTYRECENAVNKYQQSIQINDPYHAAVELVSEIERLSQSIETDEFKVIAQTALEQSEKIRRLAIGEIKHTCTPTFFPSLDKIINGFYPGQYIALAARPGQGKSLIALQMALQMASNNFPVAYITLEMSTDEQTLRCLSNKSEIPTGWLKKAVELTPSQMAEMQKQAYAFHQTPLYFNDDAMIDVVKIEQYVRSLKKQNVVGLFIDMIQLINPMSADKAKGKTEQMTNISKHIKAIAKRNGIWIVNLAAMNRDVEKTNRKPKISDIRETGQIESDSDIVLMLYRPEHDPNLPPQERPESIELIIGKNREGATGTINLEANWRICRFTEITPLTQENLF